MTLPSAVEANATFGFTRHTQSSHLTSYFTAGDYVWVEKITGNDGNASYSCFSGVYLG